MLSVLYLESADALPHLVRFYCPKAPRLLDVTYGTGTMCKKLHIPVVGVDVDPASKAHVIADSTNLPFPDGSFEAAIFDPAYLYGSRAMHMGPVGMKTWDTQRTTWKKPEDLENFAMGVAGELKRIITMGGTVFSKIMDSRLHGRMVRNRDILIRAFEDNGFHLFDEVVYLRTVTGSFTNPRTAQKAHGFYQIYHRS